MLSMSKRELSTHVGEMLRTAYADDAHPLSMDISQRIQRGRKERSMTQRDLARKMGVSPSAVAQWEIAQTKPTILNRVDLARVLGIPFVELLPESESESGDLMSVFNNPQLAALAKHYLMLPPELRETQLMTMVALAKLFCQQESETTPG